MTVSIQREPIDVASEYAQLVGPRPGAAVATFTGYVRDHSDAHAVSQLELEHYPEMALKVLMALGERAADQFGLSRWRIVHRYGLLDVAETIVWVGCGGGASRGGDQRQRADDGYPENRRAFLEAGAGP
jgi:molybdopterin synthase catalytic subunit